MKLKHCCQLINASGKTELFACQTNHQIKTFSERTGGLNKLTWIQIVVNRGGGDGFNIKKHKLLEYIKINV